MKRLEKQNKNKSKGGMLCASHMPTALTYRSPISQQHQPISINFENLLVNTIG